MKLSNLIALPFAAVIDAVSLGEAGMLRSIKRDEEAERIVDALKAVARIKNGEQHG